MNVFKILIAILIITISINAEEQKTITINDKGKYVEMLHEQLTEDYNTPNFKTIMIVKIQIDKEGNFNYEIISESDIEKLNKKTIEMLEKKKKIRFPNYKNEDFKIIVEFKNNNYDKLTKEQEDIGKIEANKLNDNTVYKAKNISK